MSLEPTFDFYEKTCKHCGAYFETRDEYEDFCCELCFETYYQTK